MSSTYVRIGYDEFYRMIVDQPVSFEERQPDWTFEYIYECEFRSQNEFNDKYVLRVYSSIDTRTDEARDNGEDAIRTVLLYLDPDKSDDEYEPVFKEKRTNRTPGWKGRVTEKLGNLMERLSNVKRCDECNRTMVIRTNSETGDRFWGCTGWPDDCRYTEDYE